MLVPLGAGRGAEANSLAKNEDSLATIYIEHIDNLYSHYVFDMEIINHTMDTLYVSPEAITLYGSPNRFPSRPRNKESTALTQANQQITLTRVNGRNQMYVESLSQKVARRRQRAATMFTVLAIGVAVYDAAKDTKDVTRSEWTRGMQRSADQRDAAVAAAVVASEIASDAAYRADENRAFLPQELFPTGPIFPGQSVRGKVFFPFEYKMHYNRIILPLGRKQYIIDFKRRHVK